MKETWVEVWKVPHWSWQLRILQYLALLGYYNIKTEDYLLLHHSKIKLNWYFVFRLPLSCDTPRRKVKVMKRARELRAKISSFPYSLCGWLVETPSRLQLPYMSMMQWRKRSHWRWRDSGDRDKRYQRMAITNEWSLGV